MIGNIKVEATDLDDAILAAGEHIVSALVAAGIDASDDSDGVVSIYGDEGWELRVWPRGSGAERDEAPVVVDLVLDRKLELDPYDGQRRLWFDPLHAVDLGELRADVHDDIPVIVAAVRAIVAGLPGGAE
jgi:hypothetical protein